MTNKFQFQITEIILVNYHTICSLIFDNYLRFEICELLFSPLRLYGFFSGEGGILLQKKAKISIPSPKSNKNNVVLIVT